MPLDWEFLALVATAVAVFVGAGAVVFELFCLATGRLEYNPNSNKLVRTKNGTEVSVGGVLGTILLGSALMLAPTVIYLFSLDKTVLQNQNEILLLEVENLKTNFSEYSLSGRVNVYLDGELLDRTRMKDAGLNWEMVRIQKFSPPERAPDGSFDFKMQLTPDGVFPRVQARFNSLPPGLVHMTDTFTEWEFLPGDLELVEVHADGRMKIMSTDDKRGNMFNIHLSRTANTVETD